MEDPGLVTVSFHSGLSVRVIGANCSLHMLLKKPIQPRPHEQKSGIQIDMVMLYYFLEALVGHIRNL